MDVSEPGGHGVVATEVKIAERQERQQRELNNLFKGFGDLAKTPDNTPSQLSPGSTGAKDQDTAPKPFKWISLETDQIPTKTEIVSKQIKRLSVGHSSGGMLGDQHIQEAVVIKVDFSNGPYTTITLEKPESEDNVTASITREDPRTAQMVNPPRAHGFPPSSDVPFDHYDEMNLDLLNQLLADLGQAPH